MSKIEVVYAKVSAVIGDRSVQFGQHFPKNDPIVEANPSLFSDDPRTGMQATAPVWERNPEEDPVEQATAAPGESRGRVRRG